MNWRPVVSTNARLVLTPGGPNLLTSWVHHNHLRVTSCVDSSYVSVDKLRGDLSVVLLQNLTKAWIVGWLYIFVIEENAVHLWMSVVKWRDP